MNVTVSRVDFGGSASREDGGGEEVDLAGGKKLDFVGNGPQKSDYYEDWVFPGNM